MITSASLVLFALVATDTRADSVRVTMYDSLAGRPLSGATVIVSPSGAAAMTDSLGRAVIAADGVSSLTVYHDIFERLGIGAIQRKRPAEGSTGDWHVAESVPSLSTLWRRLCGDTLPAVRRNIVFGVIHGERGAVVPGARVTTQWADSTRGASGTSTLTVVSDSAGRYAACGVADDRMLAISAQRDSLASGNVLIPVDEYSALRLDLLVHARATRDAGAGARGVRVTGRVVDAEGRGVNEATVWVDGIDEDARPNAQGEFTLQGVPQGTRSVGVRRLGYAAATRAVDVGASGASNVLLVVSRATTLEEFRVTSTRKAFLELERSDFEKRRLSGQSEIIDSTVLGSYSMMRHAFATLRGTEVEVNGRGEWALLGRVSSTGARCVVYVYVDGVRLTPHLQSQPELLRTIQPQDYAAVEYFSSDAHAPAKYRPLGNSCGILLLWTKSAFAR